MSLVLNRSYDESNSTGTKLSVTLATSLKTSQESTERQVSTTIEGIANLSFSETTSTSYTHVSITTHSVTLVPSSIENKFWKMYFQKLDVSQYKDNPKALSVAVETILNNFSKQLETRNLPSYNLVVKYAKELRNKSLEEIINKYFESSSTKGKHPYIEDLIVLFKGFETEVFSISKLLEIETGILKESITNSLSPGAINRDALMRVLAAKKKEKHPKLDCYVIDQSDFQDLLSYISKLKSSNQNTRFQLLIRTDAHLLPQILK